MWKYRIKTLTQDRCEVVAYPCPNLAMPRIANKDVPIVGQAVVFLVLHLRMGAAYQPLNFIRKPKSGF